MILLLSQYSPINSRVSDCRKSESCMEAEYDADDDYSGSLSQL